ncbi:zf-HC2 domain-containing protein [Candidatus Poribacteria bacterium]|nr:zf-HC2 domain-containing protein [Candidatus Poribacteria bacterium]
MAHQPNLNTCSDIQSYIEEFVMGELDSKTESTIRSHLSICDTCKHEFRMAQTIDTVLDGLEKPITPPEVLRDVTAYIRANQNSHGWLQRVLNISPFLTYFRSHLLPITTTILIIGLMGFGIYKYNQNVVLEQVKEEFYYAMNKVHIAVHKTSMEVNESFTSLNIDDVPQRALKPTIEISTSIQNSLDILHILTGSDKKPINK